MKDKNIAITIIVALVVGGVSFFGGMKYQQNRTGNLRNQIGNQFQGAVSQNDRGQFGTGTSRTNNGNGTANRGSFRPVNGEITAVDGQSITVRLVDGSSKIVIFSDKTEVNKAQAATTADLKIGETVAVFGSDNSDGSVAAQSIQLNPILNGMNGLPSGAPPAN